MRTKDLMGVLGSCDIFFPPSETEKSSPTLSAFLKATELRKPQTRIAQTTILSPHQNQVFQWNIDDSSTTLTSSCTNPRGDPHTYGTLISSSPSGIAFTSTVPQEPCFGLAAIPPYMRSKLQERTKCSKGYSASSPEKIVSTFPAMPDSSPPPQSSSPFPQSSSPPAYSSPCISSSTLPTIYEEELGIDPALVNDSYKLSPGSDATGSGDNNSSRCSAASMSTNSNSDTSPSSPMDAHLANTLPDRNDIFSKQLHRRLLAVVEERKFKSASRLERSRSQVVMEPRFHISDVLTEFELTHEVRDTKSSSPWTESTNNNFFGANERTGSCHKSLNVGSQNSSMECSLRTSSSRASPVGVVSFTDDLYDSPGTNLRTHDLFFASPSPLPSQIRVTKRRRSLSPPSHQPLKHQFRHREIDRPLVSASPAAEEGTPTPEAPAPAYRMIKRASSFLASRRKHMEDSEGALNKRIKTNSGLNTRRIEFAKRSASLRRAASLRSETGTNEESHTSNSDLVPTVPCTPQERSPIVDNSSTRRRFCRERKVIYPFPILLPPIDYVARLPISNETSAKMRLQRLIEREKAERQQDGLWVINLERESQTINAATDSSSEGNTDDESENGGWSDSRTLWESVLGIGSVLRDDVIDWILNVLPDPATTSRSSSISSSSSTVSSSSSRNSFSTISSTFGSTSSNLLDQLVTSPETRFHAAYLFLRYFYLVRAAPGSPSWNAGKGDELSEHGFESVIWDVAVGCLALSVKYHRDFLEPLMPVYAHEFQELSPYGISYDDLESSQRDLLSAFSYCLGITPQGVLDELWLALPSLRQLFDYKGGWNCLMKETWLKLFEAILEPDILRFPISLVTAGALSIAVVETLMLKYEYDAGWRVEVTRRHRPSYVSAYAGTSALQLRRKRERRAETEAEGVIQDIQAALDITSMRLEECKWWLLNRAIL